MQVEWMKPEELIPYEKNAKLHPPEQVDHLANSIKQFGWTQPIVIDADGVVVIGHGRLMAAKQLMLDKVPVVRRDDLTEDQINACRLADNKTNESPWDFGKLEEELAQLAIDGIDMAQFGFDELNTDFEQQEEKKGSMAEKYLVPPFSVIYSNKPDWLARKRAFVDLGIRSEIGRGGDLLTIQGAIQRQTSYMGGGEKQSIQEQQQTQRLSKRAKAYADGLIEKREEIRRGTYGRTV